MEIVRLQIRVSVRVQTVMICSRYKSSCIGDSLRWCGSEHDAYEDCLRIRIWMVLVQQIFPHRRL